MLVMRSAISNRLHLDVVEALFTVVPFVSETQSTNR